MEFKKGDTVRFNERGRLYARHPWRLGTYVGQSRDGECDRVQWPDVKSVRVIVKGFLEKVEGSVKLESAVAAADVMDTEKEPEDDDEEEEAEYEDDFDDLGDEEEDEDDD